jgi:hypothetical protein
MNQNYTRTGGGKWQNVLTFFLAEFGDMVITGYEKGTPGNEVPCNNYQKNTLAIIMAFWEFDRRYSMPVVECDPLIVGTFDAVGAPFKLDLCDVLVLVW